MDWYEQHPTLQQEKNAAKAMERALRERWERYGVAWDPTGYFPGYYLDKHAGSRGRWYSAYVWDPENGWWSTISLIVDDRYSNGQAQVSWLIDKDIDFDKDFFVAALRYPGPHQEAAMQKLRSAPAALQVAVDQALEKEAQRNPASWEEEKRPGHPYRMTWIRFPGGVDYLTALVSAIGAPVEQHSLRVHYPARIARAFKKAADDLGLALRDAQAGTTNVRFGDLLVPEPGPLGALPRLFRSEEEAQQAAVQHVIHLTKHLVRMNHPWAIEMQKELPPAAQVMLDQLLEED